EAALLQRAADNDPVESVRLRSAVIVAFLFRVGLRVSELCNLTMGDLTRNGGSRVAWVTLKGNRRHPYKIPVDVERRMNAYLASRGIGNAIARRGESGDSSSVPVIATSSGGPMHRTEVDALVKRLAKHAGIEEP